jgi:heptaprenyl diphosphate synthase
LHEAVQTPYSFVEEAARYLIDLGGKRFRPALVIAGCGLGLADERIDDEGMIRSGVIVELTHVASLYHDDVMDEATVRRGAPTAHRRWTNSVAIMVGDFLLAQASQIGAVLGEEFMVYQAQTLATLVQGQIAEMRGPGPGVDPITHHLDVINGKTAALIAASARYGGMFARLDSDQIEALTRYGQRLGMAFQLADDLLDIVGHDFGKQPGTDLREGVPTLAPLLIAQANRPEDARLLEFLAGPVSEDDIPEALALLRANPAIREVRAQIQQWSDDAAAQLDGFCDDAATRALRLLCDQAVVRTV